MAIPDYQSIMLPLLQHISDGEVYTARGIRGDLADHFEMSEAERSHMLSSGQQTTFANRVAWAKTYLDRAGLLKSVKRGHFVITDRGREVCNSSIPRIDNDFLKQFEGFNEFIQRSSNQNVSSAPDASETSHEEQTPEEALQNSFRQIRDDLASEILEQIRSMSPIFFEKLVLNVMTSMGYGGTQDSASSLTAAGADEGIDGVINEDQLGLDIIYLQAKRWENPVGRPEIQKFVGALHGKRARKGVFLTTSTYSRDAYTYVETIDPKVVLVDGKRLANLMIDFDVGVSTAQTYAVKRIDTDYFTED